jgi:cytochrome b subunit of formate dehydrogenase/RNase P subunit RPR2
MTLRSVWGAALLVLFLSCRYAFALEDAECFTCHGNANMSKKLPDGSIKSLHVDQDLYKASIHTGEGCVSCHSDVSELPHKAGLEKAKCDACHDQGEEYEKSPHGQLLKAGDQTVAGCSDCHGVHDIRKVTDPLSHMYPVNMPQTCGRCHSDPMIIKTHMISIANPSDSYLKSKHAKSILAGNLKAATCVNCHGSHGLLPANNPASRVYRANIPETCGECHPEPLAQYKESIHGRAFAKGIKDAPTCFDCHGEHDIEAASEENSTVNPRNVVTKTCVKCHDNENIMKRYGIVTGRQASYMDSYHGLASAAGSNVVATCASCHESHRILPQDDPASSVNHANLPKTCGKCHKNAGPNFAVGAVHIMPTDPGQAALGIVRLLYIILIGAIIGGMIVHNTLVMARRAIGKFKDELDDEGTYRRFTTAMTIGHLALTFAFITLALSGFALRYPETWWAKTLFHGETGLYARGIVHRVAAFVLIGVALCNGSFLLFTKSGRKELGSLMMRFQDLKDVFHNMAYVVGIVKIPPRFDRYSYIEKFEYWGMWWGTLLMIFTGFCMGFVNIFLKFFPKLALDVVALIHFYEAWLAVLTIVVWHLYYMIFDPQTYPMNWSWITGRITLDDMKERHSIEYEREIVRNNKEQPNKP